ncbi:MAG: hypothetical protein KKD44_08615 [Proteobacteria bacterium]|nr:hypothetical protein [Pseudomonadota bacterium]
MTENSRVLNELLNEFKGYLSSALSCVSSPENRIDDVFTYIENHLSCHVADVLKTDTINLKEMFQCLVKKDVQTLAVMPCCDFILDNLGVFQKYFSKIILCDNIKKGRIINGIEIIDQDEFSGYTDDVDAFLIPTSDRLVQNIFLESIPGERAIVFEQFADEVSHRYRARKTFGHIKSIVEQIRCSPRALVVLGIVYYSNYTPIYTMLKRRGYDIFIIASQPEHIHPPYSHTNTSIDDIAPFATRHYLEFYEMLYLLRHLDRGHLWVTAEAFCVFHGDVHQMIVRGYAFAAAVMSMARIPTVLSLTDVIVPFVKQATEDELVGVYTEVLRNASGVILSANTHEAGDFLKQSVSLDKPMTTFLRYNYKALELQEKKKDGFHLVMMWGFLEKSSSIRQTIPYVKSMLNQGIHIHYYSDDPETKAFYDSLDDDEQRYFHRHAFIKDQQKLMYEISSCHAGWLVHNTQVLVDNMSELNSPFLRDLFYMFHMTTVPSSALLFGSAGIPMFINRSMQGLLNEFPSEFFIPLELSEIKNLGGIIKGKNWDEIFKETYAARNIFTVEENIDRLIDFVDSLKPEII